MNEVILYRYELIFIQILPVCFQSYSDTVYILHVSGIITYILATVKSSENKENIFSI